MLQDFYDIVKKWHKQHQYLSFILWHFSDRKETSKSRNLNL